MVCALLICAHSILAQEPDLRPRVVVLPIKATVDDASLSIIANTIKETLDLNLSMMNEYRLVKSTADVSLSEDLNKTADEARLDYIIFGEANRTENDSFQIEVSVYEHKLSEVVSTVSGNAESVTDIFETADLLTARVIEDFTGIHVGYGAITLENTGVPGRYSVLLDDLDTSETGVSLDKVLNGKHHISIKQHRWLGEHVVIAESVQVIEDETVSVSFQIPYLLPSEREYLDSLQSKIESLISRDISSAKLEEVLGNTEQLFENVDFSPRLVEEAVPIKILRKRWLALKDAASKPESMNTAQPIDQDSVDRYGDYLSFMAAEAFSNRKVKLGNIYYAKIRTLWDNFTESAKSRLTRNSESAAYVKRWMSKRRIRDILNICYYGHLDEVLAFTDNVEERFGDYIAGIDTIYSPIAEDLELHHTMRRTGDELTISWSRIPGRQSVGRQAAGRYGCRIDAAH